MGKVATSASDPIFLLHHTNVDRIFEKWLRRHNSTSDAFPTISTPTGHNRCSYMVSFFPVYTNEEFFKKSEYLGYTYEDIDDQGLPLDPNEREKELKAVKEREPCEPNPQRSILKTELFSVVGAVLFLVLLAVKLLNGHDQMSPT
ncbi:tyrosinase-like [Ptychodera flava]|uniref:tyrosinase-like n=1 Tax=Ptychodera flava TaxID=63121 RepID=UPI00396A65B5